jgi:hypothetical protein
MRATSSRWTLAVLALLAVLLVAAQCGFPDEDLSSIGQVVKSAPPALAPLPITKAVLIADPNRARFPTDSVTDCFARSVWALHAFEGRLYVGAGDLWNNSGPTAIYSVGDDGVTTDVKLETIVDDEAVMRFREGNGALLVPGPDATESWDFGNFYSKHAGVWQKHRTIPGGLHVWDLAVVQGVLYAEVHTSSGKELFQSLDQGKSWTSIAKDTMVGALVALDTSMLIVDANRLYQLNNGVFTRVPARIPRMTEPDPIRFGDGALFTERMTFLPYPGSLYPLVYASASGASLQISRFGAETSSGVRDIVVENGTVYLLLGRRPSKAGYLTSIYRSSDLQQWTKLAELTFPAPPYSLARLGGRMYVGLGADGVPPSDSTPEPKSGSIWRLE